jgi:hypothetical protein
MKFMNWGKSIFLVYVLFVAGMIYLVYGAVNTKFDLVEDNYYQKELEFQTEINESNKANSLGITAEISQNQGNTSLKLNRAKGSAYFGQVHFYNASDKSKDFKYDLPKQDIPVWVLPVSKVNKGHYILKIRWFTAEKDTFRTEVPFEKL